MKRILLLMIAVLALAATSAQLSKVLPVGIKQFFAEREMLQSLVLKNNSLSQLGIKPTFVSPHRVNGVDMLEAFIDFDSPDALTMAKAHGLVVNCEFDDFATAMVPVDRLIEISQLPGINVEISKLVDLCTDSTLSVTHAGQVIHGTQNGLRHDYDGTGVIVGMIDSGFDYQHLAFRSSDDVSRTRIVRVYDLLDSTAHPVVSSNNNIMPGRVFMGEQIDTLRCDGGGTHGTHTTSIAAGMHVNGYGGMAPGADIVLCVCRGMDMLVSEVEVVNCIQYICSYADSVGKPCVVNMSISTLNGPHDGNDRISKAITQKSGPGRIFVVSAGNNGELNHYSGGPSTMVKPFGFLLGYDVPDVNDADKSYYYRSTTNEIWIRDKNVRPVVAFHVYDKTTNRIVWESSKMTLYGRVDWTEFGNYYEPDPAVSNDGYMYVFISQNNSGKYQATCNLFNLKSKSYSIDSNGKITSRYQIGVTVYPPRVSYPRQPDSCYVDMWTCSGKSVTPPDVICFDVINETGDTVVQEVQGYYAIPSNRVSIGSYAVGDSTISAGAYAARNSFWLYFSQQMAKTSDVVGCIASFSSYQYPGYGPKGVALPTVCAPGVNVVAAGSRFSSYFTLGYRKTVMKTEDGSYWGVMTGTSMAAPTVAGIIAQWLQVNPNLSTGDVMDIIENTAIKDEFTMDPDLYTRYGPNGKIDAMAGIRYLLDKMPDEFIPGDANGDGSVDVEDVTLMIKYILGMNPVGIVFEAGDINQDGSIDVEDLTSVIRAIINAV